MSEIKDQLKQLKREREKRSRTRQKAKTPETFADLDQDGQVFEKQKLEQLKKLRKTKPKSQQVTEKWEKIDKEEDLTVKEKLEKLITLSRTEKKEKIPEPQAFEPLPREPIQFFENPYSLDAKYGKITPGQGLEIDGEILSCLSKDPSFKSLDLSTTLFFDLETTGLSGGTGIIPFLVGMGYYRDDKFCVDQYFLGDIGEEERMIKELVTFFSQMDFQSVVTFNGKSYDMPLLETRFILNRQPLILSKLPHLDFLFSARSLWKHKYESCRLTNLARKIVMAGREEDIPSSEVPYLYFQFLRTGDFSLMEPVLYHNVEDILSLLGLVIIGAGLFSTKEDEWVEDSMDLYGVGKVYEKMGDEDKSIKYFQKALEGNLREDTANMAKKKLSYHFKKNSEWDKAVPIWKELYSADQIFSFRELAMYYEHKEKQYEEARRIAEEGFVLSMEIASTYFRNDFSYRLERLKRKIKLQKEQAESKKAK